MNCPCCQQSVTSKFTEHRFKLELGESKEITYLSNYYSCSKCGHIWYHSEEINEAILSDYYSNKTNPYVGDEKRRDTTLEKIRDIICAFGFGPEFLGRDAVPQKLVEIGGAEGNFAECFMKGNFANRFSYTIVDPGRDFAGSPYFSRLFSINEIEDKSIDGIICRHTLEHIIDLEKFLFTTTEKLIDGALLYFEVPCWTIPYWKVDELNAEHFHHFTHESIGTLFKKMGFFEPVFDFSASFEEYFTPNRIMGHVFRFRAEKFPNKNLVLDHEEAFKLKVKASRDNLKNLAVFVEKLATDQKLIGFHGAGITLEDFLLNEGIELRATKGIYVFDTNQAKKGKELSGLVTQEPSPEVAKELDVVISFSSFFKEIETAWRLLGFKGNFFYYLDTLENSDFP